MATIDGRQLPQWAADRITELERLADRATDELARHVRTEEPTRIRIGDVYSDTPTYAPNAHNSRVMYCLGPDGERQTHTFIQLRLDDDGNVLVHASGPVQFSPRSSNSCTLSVLNH